jgi:selenocysteine lyase/cysteine desulfurase
MLLSQPAAFQRSTCHRHVRQSVVVRAVVSCDNGFAHKKNSIEKRKTQEEWNLSSMKKIKSPLLDIIKQQETTKKSKIIIVSFPPVQNKKRIKYYLHHGIQVRSFYFCCCLLISVLILESVGTRFSIHFMVS